MEKTAKSIEELFPLIEACKVGDLKKVAAWIGEGNPVNPPPARRRSSRRMPLQIAIEKNFLSLAELLLKGGVDPMANGNALELCVWKGRSEIARPLLEFGVPVSAVNFVRVAETGDADLIRLFLERGADPVKNDPFYHALLRVTHPIAGFIREWKEMPLEIQSQVDAALLYFVMEKNGRGVGLCLWAGAQAAVPAREVRTKGEEWTEVPLIAAAWGGDLTILKAMKPADHPGMLTEMLANSRGALQVVRYLLELGAILNEKSNGGSSLLDRRISSFGSDLRWSQSPSTKEDLEVIRYLVSQGAKWVPDENTYLRGIRSNFSNLSPDLLLELVKVLVVGGGVEPRVVEDLLNTPRMKEVAGRQLETIKRILHPPPPSVKAPPPEVIKGTPEKRKKRKVKKPARLPITELRKNAETYFINFICQRPNLPFWEPMVWDWFDVIAAKRAVGLVEADDHSIVDMLKEAAERVSQKLPEVKVLVGNRINYDKIEFHLEDGVEWMEVIKKAWTLLGRDPNRYFLSDAGALLLTWAEDPEHQKEFIKERSLSHKIGLRSQTGVLHRYFDEVGRKSPMIIRFEKKGDSSSHPPLCYRLSLESKVAVPPSLESPNPVMDFKLERASKPEFDRVLDLVSDHLLDRRPEGTVAVGLYHIDTRRELKRCFPKECPEGFEPFSGLNEFFTKLPLPPEIQSKAALSGDEKAWTCILSPTRTWSDAVNAIVRWRDRPSLQSLYGLSKDAALLLEWVRSLGPDRLKHGLSPIVEDCLLQEIGIRVPWEMENLAAYFAILTDEINERTPWDLRVQPWNHHEHVKTRLRVKKRETAEADVVRQIQWLALEQGRAVAANEVAELLAKWIGTSEGDPKATG